jgi:hypothetical protein
MMYGSLTHKVAASVSNIIPVHCSMASFTFILMRDWQGMVFGIMDIKRTKSSTMVSQWKISMDQTRLT